MVSFNSHIFKKSIKLFPITIFIITFLKKHYPLFVFQKFLWAFLLIGYLNAPNQIILKDKIF